MQNIFFLEIKREVKQEGIRASENTISQSDVYFVIAKVLLKRFVVLLKYIRFAHYRSVFLSELLNQT